jgi:hypothetical protein
MKKISNLLENLINITTTPPSPLVNEPTKSSSVSSYSAVDSPQVQSRHSSTYSHGRSVTVNVSSLQTPPPKHKYKGSFGTIGGLTFTPQGLTICCYILIFLISRNLNNANTGTQT